MEASKHFEPMASEEPSSIPTALRLSLTLRDPEVIHECLRFPADEERNRYATGALRIGVLALRQASGEVDVTKIQHEANRLLDSLTGALTLHAQQFQHQLATALRDYFDPNTGQLVQRLKRLVDDGGELQQVLASFVSGESSEVARTLSQLVGADSDIFRLLSPDQRDGFHALLTQSVEEMLQAHRERILSEFSLDSQDSALARLVAQVANANGALRLDLASDLNRVHQEFSLDNENGALARLVRHVESASREITEQFSQDNEGSALARMTGMLQSTHEEIERRLTLDDEASPLSRLRRELQSVVDGLSRSQVAFQQELREAVTKLVTRHEQAAKTTVHGDDFEDAAAVFLAAEAEHTGDIYDHVGTRVGSIPNSKVGDHIIALGPDTAAPGARIVVETKATRSFSLQKALDELDTAKKNRGAQVGIFIFSKDSAPDGLQPVGRWGTSVVTTWDHNDPASDLALRCAVSLARALTVREAKSDAEDGIDLVLVDRALNAIEKELKSFDEIIQFAKTAETAAQKIRDRAQIISTRATSHLETLTGQIDRLRAPDGEAS